MRRTLGVRLVYHTRQPQISVNNLVTDPMAIAQESPKQTAGGLRSRTAPRAGYIRLENPSLEFTRQIGLILIAAVFYSGVRKLTEGATAVAVENGLEVLAFERRMGIAIEHWAQDQIIHSQWMVAVANWIYLWGHWPVIAFTLLWLHRTNRSSYLVLRNALFISGAVGLVIFTAYAVAPPRLLGVGLVDTIRVHSTSYQVLQPPSLVNRYAAIPSFHVGWSFLIAVAHFRVTEHRLVRLACVVGPVLMACAVVVTANHYVVDGVVGIAVSLAALIASDRVTPQLAAGRAGLPIGRFFASSGGAQKAAEIDIS